MTEPTVRTASFRAGWLLVGAIVMAGCGSSGDGAILCQGLGGNTVSGQVVFEKRLYDHNGYTNQSVFLPVRYADVEVVGPEGVLATTTTNADGRYCAIYVQQGEPRVNSVSIMASSNVPFQKLKVGRFFVDVIGDVRFARWAVSQGFDERLGNELTLDFTIRAASLGGVFNILDTLTNGTTFFRNIRGKVPPILTAVWQEQVGRTFFITEESCATVGIGVEGDCIFVRGDGELFFGEPIGEDRDEYDDDILLHEYGHFITHNFSFDTSPGGPHYLNDHTQDIRLSWSEGWATFFSSAIRRNPVNVDVGVTGISLFAFSIESNSLLFPPQEPGLLEGDAIYTTSEVAVASVLWDIFDGPTATEPFDRLSLGFGPIWDVLNGWNSSPPPQSTMEHFWESFLQFRPDLITTLGAITDERKMEFFPDACEVSDACNPSLINKADDNSFARATPAIIGQSRRHTLFPADDVDVMSFEAEPGKSYAIETLRLKNGADTYLEIFYDNGGQSAPLSDSAGKPFVNDNPPETKTGEGCAQLRDDGQGNLKSNCPNNETALASKITLSSFVPPDGCSVPCMLYAKVRRSPFAPPSTGRFGSYQFLISETAAP